MPSAVLRRLESAMLVHLEDFATQLPHILLKKGYDTGEIATPCVLVYCLGSDGELIKDSGNEGIRCFIEVRSSMDEPGVTEETHATRCALVFEDIFNPLRVPALNEVLSGYATNLYIYDMSYSGAQESIEGRSWVSKLELTAVAVGLTVTA